jgi:hypothetical protein
VDELHAQAHTDANADLDRHPACAHTRAGAKVESNTVATLLPSYKGRQRLASAVKLLSTMVHDDKDAQEYMCGLVVSVSGRSGLHQGGADGVRVCMCLPHVY